MNRRAVLLVAALAASVVAPTSSVAQDRKAGDLKIEPYMFVAGNDSLPAELGRLVVPENRRNPNSRLIEVAFVRFKSTATNPGSPIVYLAGGPGGSGIGAARGTRFPLFMAMREIGDVIAFDQRATGMSRPSVDCSESLNYPLDKAGEPHELIRLYQERAQACTRAFKEQGVDIGGYNTNESADDLEDLRKALGAAKISLWGISYGTHLALAAIRRHESSIHRVILAGVEGPADTWKLPGNIQDNLEKINQLAKQDPNLSDKVPDLITLMRTVLDRLEKQPIVVEVSDPRTRQTASVTMGKFDLQRATASVVGNTEVAGLPALYYALANNNLSYALVKSVARNVARERVGPIGSAMPPAMDCASGADPERLQRIEREARGTLLGSTIDFPFPGVCSGLGDLDLGPAFRAPVQSKVPTLIISGTLDARTPIANGEEVRRGFSNSTHLIIDGAVHSDPLFLSSPRIKDVMLEFMRGEPISTTRVQARPMKFTPFLRLPQSADPSAGTEEWEGALDAGGQKLRLVLRLEKNRRGAWEAELKSLDQGNTISAIDSVQYGPSKVMVMVNGIGATFDGTMNVEKSEIAGQWKQGTRSTPLQWRRR